MLKMLHCFPKSCLIYSKDLRNTVDEAAQDEAAQGSMNNCASNGYDLGLDSISNFLNRWILHLTCRKTLAQKIVWVYDSISAI